MCCHCPKMNVLHCTVCERIACSIHSSVLLASLQLFVFQTAHRAARRLYRQGSVYDGPYAQNLNCVLLCRPLAGAAMPLLQSGHRHEKGKRIIRPLQTCMSFRKLGGNSTSYFCLNKRPGHFCSTFKVTQVPRVGLTPARQSYEVKPKAE